MDGIELTGIVYITNNITKEQFIDKLLTFIEENHCLFCGGFECAVEEENV